jgi:hypothetical protein
MEVQSHPRQVIRENLSLKKKKKITKRADAVAQGVGPEFTPQYHKKTMYMTRWCIT